jgi:Protein of unknown function (DUF1501)
MADYRYCDGIRRRDLLQIGALSALGLTLPDWLRMRAAQAATAGVASGRRGGASGQKEVACILLWMNGGPSHIDTFDPKPEAPAEIRGEFAVIPTNVKGVYLSEHLPKLAQQTDKFSILRSVTSPDGSHESATHYLLTGYPFTPALSYPSYGSVVARERGFRDALPPYALMGGYPFGYGGAGYMGAVYNPFNIGGNPGSKNFSVKDVTLPAGVAPERMDRRRAMLAALDSFQRQVETEARAVRTMDQFYERAYNLVTSPLAKKAFNLADEPDKLRDEYGRTTFGQSCLLARRLVEAGVPFITINQGGWDTHENNFKELKKSRLPELDQGYAALLKDLHARGMLDHTLVLWMGEFGRTPKVNASAGRDHWPNAMCVCMGGGPVRRGIVVGETNERAEVPKERPIRVEDVAATIYQALGVDYHKEYESPQNRPIKINYDGEPIREVL